MQTATQTQLGFSAGVKDYRLTYYMKDYRVVETDLLAAFRVIPQPGFHQKKRGQQLLQSHLLGHGRQSGPMVLEVSTGIKDVDMFRIDLKGRDPIH